MQGNARQGKARQGKVDVMFYDLIGNKFRYVQSMLMVTGADHINYRVNLNVMVS